MTLKNQSNHDFEPKVVVTSISFSKSTVLRKWLLDVFPNSIFNETGQRLSGVELVEFIGAVRGNSSIVNGTSQDALEVMKITDHVYENSLFTRKILK